MKNTLKGFTTGVITTALLTTSIAFASDGAIQKKIEVVMNKVKLQVNSQQISTPNFLYDGKTYVPLRDVASALNKEINWDGVNYTVTITDKSNEVINDVIVVTKEITDTSEYLEAKLKLPVLQGMKNTKLQETINSTLENKAIDFKNSLAKDGKEYIEDAKKYDFPLRPYQADVSYEIGYNKNNIVSFPVTYWEYTGGAHGNYKTTAYNIDLKTGHELSLEDIFKAGTNYKNIISQEIKKHMEIEKDQLFEESITNFKTFSDDQKFYLDSDNNLVFYFDPYEIAPYSSGTIEFKIPFTQIKDILNEQILSE